MSSQLSPDLRVAPLRVPTPLRRVIGTADDEGTRLDVFPLALFGSTFGWSVQESAAHAILDRFVEAGGNLIQSADHHADGNSERMIGRWLASRGARDHLVLSATVGRAEGIQQTPAGMRAAVDATLTRLGTDRLDLLVLHGGKGQGALDNLLSAAEEIIAAGKARLVAGGDVSGVQLLQARIAAGMIGAPLLSAVQTTYNLVQRNEFEREFARLVAVQSLAVMPKHALANGYLTGLYSDRDRALRSERGIIAHRHHDRRGLRILKQVEQVAGEYGVQPASIAIAWLLTRSQVVAPVVSAGSVNHVDSLIAGSRLQLAEEHVAQLDAVSGPDSGIVSFFQLGGPR